MTVRFWVSLRNQFFLMSHFLFRMYGDFVVGKKTLEIGGRHKTIKGADFVLRDDTDLPGKKSIPLWSLGMMY